MPTDPSIRALVLVVASASLVAVARGAYPLTTDSNCHCFKTNATASHYFAHHQFFDFRSLWQDFKVPKPIDDFNASAQAAPPSAFFTHSKFANAWAIMNWDNTALMGLNNSDVNDATVKMVNSPNNVYIDQDSGQTHLTLRTVRHAAFQSAAEIESTSTGYHFLSVRMRARTKGSPGAVTAMFTYRPPPSPQNQSLVQEADLEILTRDPPAYVQYTNQPAWNATSDIPDATRNVTLPGGRRWTDWADYRMDWTPGSSTWFVNGQQVSRINFQAPRDPAQVIFNAWSDGGSWSGEMAVGTEAYLQIRWIEMVYNSTTDHGGGKQPTPSTSTSSSGKKCANMCSIDETSQIGTPVLLVPSSGSGGSQPQPGNSCASAKYGQCAGKNWNGCQSCAAGSTCRYQNEYYSQCL